MSSILDSGNRRDFGTGAVRDMADGKGRFDLMPLTNIADWIEWNSRVYVKQMEKIQEVPIISKILQHIGNFIYDGDIENLYYCLSCFTYSHFETIENMLLQVSKHYENGTKKYGERNWEKGINIHSYIDSACRHFIKFCYNCCDEPHDLAFMWNIMCCLWTIDNCNKELIDLPYTKN